MKRLLLCLMLATIVPALVLAQRPNDGDARQPFDPKAKKPAPTSGPQILYHGGPVMTGAGNHIYVIYYGDFPTSRANIIDTFLENLGGSGAYNVNTTYSDAQGSIQNLLAYHPASDSYNDTNSLGSKLGSSFAVPLLQSAFSGNHLPVDSNGIYLEIISPEVSVSSGNYCGYHTHSSAVVPGVDIKYAVIPDPGPKHYACSGNVAVYRDATSPNGDIGADSVCDTAIHEISETVTDPDLNAWFGPHGEVGDLCSFNYGTTNISTNGSHYNQIFGGREYLVQTIWENKGNGFCAQSLP